MTKRKAVLEKVSKNRSLSTLPNSRPWALATAYCATLGEPGWSLLLRDSSLWHWRWTCEEETEILHAYERKSMEIESTHGLY